VNALDRLVSAGRLATGVPVGRHTTYKLGGPARYFAEVADRPSLEAVIEAWRGSGVPVLVLGWGSNLVVADAGFDGLVVRPTGEFTRIDLHPLHIEAGCAARLPMLARAAVAAGRLGLEFYVGIPGTVGGAVRQNAGCHGSETSDRLLWAEVLDMVEGRTSRRTPLDLDLAYRHSNIAETDLVLSAGFMFESGDPAEGERRIREVTRWRKQHQPGGTLNAGSVFKNPPGDAAGRLIDQAGLKGFRVGGVSVSDRHANFFVAEEGATASDLARLIAEVRRRVLDLTGVELETEIRLVGDFQA
jgi:UDP-N-acetylmuramate dehydrogenase